MHNLLHAATFDRKCLESHAVGAGIMPVAYDKATNCIYCLLAREQLIPSWKGSHKWSSFEGGRHDGERILDTALREWREESMNVIANIGENTLNDYVCCFTIKVLQQNYKHSEPKYHVMYLVEIPYDETYVDKFSRRRQQLLNLTEKQKAYNTMLDLILGDAHSTITDIYWDKNTLVFETATCMLEFDSPLPLIIEQWLDEQVRLNDAIGSLKNVDGVTCTRNNNFIFDLKINQDYLEKDVIRWWSLDELQQVLTTGGRSHEECFRTYFLPVLDGITTFLSSNDVTNHIMQTYTNGCVCCS